MIKEDLPNTPDEVIDVWLEPHSKRENIGWPPTLDNEWRFILGKGRDLAYLKSLSWNKEEKEIRPNLFKPKHINIVLDLFKTYVLGQRTIYSAISDGKVRFDRCCEYLTHHGIFPKPVVLEETDEGIRILDGNHRICAYLYLYGYFNVENTEIPCLNVKRLQSVWLARR